MDVYFGIIFIMETLPKISVIIPVYNVEKYLDACLHSIVEQTYLNLEIVLVDDGSTDESGKKCEEWANKDSRIQVIHKKNTGLNMARKSGWESSTGLYITFVDSDDMLNINALETSLSILNDEGVDMVAFMYREFSGSNNLDTQIESQSPIEYDKKETTSEAFRFLISNGYKNMYPMTAWGKLYKKELIDGVDWEESNFRAYEDNFFTPQIYDKVRSFAILKQQLYLYRKNDNDTVLSRMIVGNSLNNKPVGYLEYLSLMRASWQKYIQKHDTSLEIDLDEFCYANEVFRLNNLIEANLLGAENNIKFIGSIITKIQNRLSNIISNKDTMADSQSKKIIKYREETVRLRKELDSLKIEIARLQTPKGATSNLLRVMKKIITKNLT